MRNLTMLLTFAAALLLTACHRGNASQGTGDGDSVVWRHARHITIVKHDGYTIVDLKNPWKEGKTLHRYVLVPRSAGELPHHLPAGTVVRTPLQRAMIFTTVHASLLTELRCEPQVAGVADLKYIKIPWIHQQVATGRLADCGDGMNPVVEKIIDAEADAIMLSPFENSGGYGRLEDIDIPLIECAEYMEVSPLARAEWMRFYGMLFGVEQQADSLFDCVERHYLELKRTAAKAGKGRSVLMDKQTGTVWYTPGGRSTIGQMLQDAGAAYPFADDEHSGSVPLPFESILEKAGDSDVWLLRYDADKPLTMQQLTAEQPGYSQLRPVRNRQVYACNVQTSLFYEESPFHPDLQLQDMIQICHPDIKGLPPLRYYLPVE